MDKTFKDLEINDFFIIGDIRFLKLSESEAEDIVGRIYKIAPSQEIKNV